jgi:L-iditol 2-dehydrogenase
MKVARFYAPGDIRIEDADEPVAGPGELKLRVRACSTCGTDVKIFRFGHHHIVPPRVIGHEIAGEVVQVGDGATGGWQPGDRVQVIAAIPCGQCPDCLRGRQTICPNQESMGYHYDGGFAEYMVVPAKVLAVDGVHRIPDGVDYVSASITEPMACVLNGQEIARVGDGDTVVVVGAGPIGCLHVRMARARGAQQVYLVELNASRLALATGLVAPDAAICAGQTDAVDEVRKLTDGRGADVVITAAASGQAQQDAVQMAARQGRPDQLLRRSAEGQPGDRTGLQPGALPRADHRRCQRLQPRAQPQGTRPDRQRQGPGGRPRHPPDATDRRAVRDRHRRQRRGHQGDDLALAARPITLTG